MDMTGEFRIPAPRQRVWEGLNDPEILKQSIPGCETIEKLSDTEFAAKVTARVGPVKANFNGKVALSDLDPPNGYTIGGEGQGGVAGFAKGGARVSLAEEGGETVLHYEVHAQVGGKLAQIGSRLIDATARKMAQEFFGRFAQLMAPEEAGASAASPAAGAIGMARVALPVASGAGGAGGAGEGVRLPPAVWVTGLTAIVALMLYFFAIRGAGH
jgi:uncharacterized protein